MPHKSAVQLRLDAAKLELIAAVESLSHITSDHYTPQQAAYVRGATYQIERALRITNNIYLTVDTVKDNTVRLLPKPNELPIEEGITDDQSESTTTTESKAG